jgi:hypothetical protein
MPDQPRKYFKPPTIEHPPQQLARKLNAHV